MDVQLLADAENPIDLTGADVEIQLLDDVLDPTAQLEVVVDVFDPVQGRIRLSIDGADTLALLPEATAASRLLTGDLRVSFLDGIVKSYFTLNLTIDATRSRPA
jgi:hypothetical protein